MRLTRKQLDKLIRETLDLNEAPKVLNFRKMRKDLFALKDDIDNQELLDKVQKHMEDLRDKVDAGEGKFLKGRYREAVTLLKSIEDIMKAPTPEKIKDVEKEIVDVIKKDPKPSPEPDPWNPDPDPKSSWEYQLRDCVWYTRMKETTKEFKLGHASGKPVIRKKNGGTFLTTIVLLNKTYPDLVKDCNPLLKPPKPKPGKKSLAWPENAANLIMTKKIPGENDMTGIPKWKKSFEGACRNYLSTDGKSLVDFYKGMNPGVKFTGVFEWIALEQRQGGSQGKNVAAALIDEVNEMSKEVARKTKGLNNHDPSMNPLAGDTINESLSRGSLYRRRYYGRY